MSSRVFGRGAGVACLAAALVGYTVAMEDNNFLPRLPGDGNDDEDEAPRKPYLRAPLPEPSFGASATRLPSPTGTSTTLKTRRQQLLGSASAIPAAASSERASLVRPLASAPAEAQPSLPGADEGRAAPAVGGVARPAAIAALSEGRA